MFSRRSNNSSSDHPTGPVNNNRVMVSSKGTLANGSVMMSSQQQQQHRYYTRSQQQQRPPSTMVEETEVSVMKRSSSTRRIPKKNRPHSWHSTLQRGFQRARSRSSGRDKNRQSTTDIRASVGAAGGKRESSDPAQGKEKVGEEEQLILLVSKFSSS